MTPRSKAAWQLLNADVDRDLTRPELDAAIDALLADPELMADYLEDTTLSRYRVRRAEARAGDA